MKGELKRDGGQDHPLASIPHMKTLIPFEWGRGRCHLGKSHELADIFRQEDHITVLGHHSNETLQGLQVQVIHLLVSLSFRLILRTDWKERDRQRA